VRDGLCARRWHPANAHLTELHLVILQAVLAHRELGRVRLLLLWLVVQGHVGGEDVVQEVVPELLLQRELIQVGTDHRILVRLQHL